MTRNEGALDELRRRAGAMGADAVVSVGFRHGDAEGEPMHLSGMAVRCEDMLRGRAYDIVGRVEATAPMGHEAEGLRTLRRQARDLRADLIIQVRFDHGRGEDEPTRVSGDAIRFRAVPVAWTVSRPGLVHRGVVWASGVVDRSSEYNSSGSFSAEQVLGFPDVYPRYGDSAEAWAPSSQGGGAEHLTVRFPEAVYASAIAVVETFRPGALVRIDDVTPGGATTVLWEGVTAPVGEARILSLELSSPRRISALRVVLRTTRVTGWNEIDAIGLLPHRPGGS